MYLIQILLPTHDNDGQPFAREAFAAVRTELADRFGGVTAFVQSPALGLWRDDESGTTLRDRMILVEVMTDALDVGWWKAYRERLERSFRQDAIVARALEYRAL